MNDEITLPSLGRKMNPVSGTPAPFICGLFLLFAGCDQKCFELAEQDAELRIGSGIDGFNPIGDTTGFARGMQGGYHIYAALQATGLHGGPSLLINKKTPLVTYTMHSDDDLIYGGIESVPIRMNTLPDGRIEFFGEFAIFENYDPEELEGTEIEIFAEIQDSCGRTASSSVRTTLGWGTF